MKKAILATKVGMTQIFNEDGSLIPVTVLQAGPCVVTQIKTVENDGYSAVQVGFVDKKDKIVNKDKAGKKEVIHRNGAAKAEDLAVPDEYGSVFNKVDTALDRVKENGRNAYIIDTY